MELGPNCRGEPIGVRARRERDWAKGGARFGGYSRCPSSRRIPYTPGPRIDDLLPVRTIFVYLFKLAGVESTEPERGGLRCCGPGSCGERRWTPEPRRGGPPTRLSFASRAIPILAHLFDWRLWKQAACPGSRFLLTFSGFGFGMPSAAPLPSPRGRRSPTCRSPGSSGSSDPEHQSC